MLTLTSFSINCNQDEINITHKHLFKSSVDVTVWKTTDCLLKLHHLFLVTCHIFNALWSTLLLPVSTTYSVDYSELTTLNRTSSNNDLFSWSYQTVSIFYSCVSVPSQYTTRNSAIAEGPHISSTWRWWSSKWIICSWTIENTPFLRYSPLNVVPWPWNPGYWSLEMTPFDRSHMTS